MISIFLFRLNFQRPKEAMLPLANNSKAVVNSSAALVGRTGACLFQAANTFDLFYILLCAKME